MKTKEEIDKLRAEWLLTHVPDSYRSNQEKAFTGKCSPRLAIKAMCQQCVGFELAKESISGCTVYKCPLFEFRPYVVRPKKVLSPEKRAALRERMLKIRADGKL